MRILKSKWFLIPAAIVISLYALTKIYFSFNGRVEKITFSSNGIEIEGAIVRPEGDGPFPGILFLHGSGGSHQEYDKAYNKLHANELTKRGFAVLCYTKRGSGNNHVNYNHVGFNDLIADAVAALQVLKDQSDVDPRRIGIFAVSESGWFSAEVAERSGDIKFIINRVGTPLDWRSTVIHEVRNDMAERGLTEKEIEEDIVPLTKRWWQFFIDASQSNNDIEKERASFNAKLVEINSNERFAGLYPEKLPDYDPKTYAARAEKYSYDPRPFVKRTNATLLYILGETDVNIPTTETIKELEEIKNSNGKDITIKVFPTGHYMYKYESIPIEGLYQDGYLEQIGTWAEQQVKE